jgi:hypothetical protein
LAPLERSLLKVSSAGGRWRCGEGWLELDRRRGRSIDSNGAGFAFLLGPPSAVDLVVQVIGALSTIEGKLAAQKRLNESQLRLRMLLET